MHANIRLGTIDIVTEQMSTFNPTNLETAEGKGTSQVNAIQFPAAQDNPLLYQINSAVISLTHSALLYL